MHTMVENIKIILLHVHVLFIGVYTYSGCLTWNIDGNSIEFICRFGNTSTLRLVDNYGHNVARCDIIGSSGNCSSSSFVKSNIQENAITFYIDRTRRTGINGKWSCLQQDNNFTADVLTTKDITDSTTVNLFGTISQDKDVHRLLLTCSSCRIPKGKNAEFLMNNNSVDHITFNDDTGKCTHLHGECIAGKCNCSRTGNTFTRMFELIKPLKTPTYFSCDLRFEDKAKSVVFFKVPSVSFNGIEFEDMGTRTVITKLSYNPNRPKDEDNTKETVQVVIAVFSALVFLLILLALLVLLYRKRKHLKMKKEKEKKCLDECTEMLDEPVLVQTEGPLQYNDISLQCVISGNELIPISETNDQSIQVKFEEGILLPETNDKSFQVNFEEYILPHETTDQSVQVNFKEDSLLHETNDKSIIVNFEEDSISHGSLLQNGEQIQEQIVSTETNGKSIRVNLDNKENDILLPDIVERVLNILSMGVSFSRPAQPADAKLDVIFMNCESIIEQKWVLIVAEVLEKEYGLHCGIPGIDIESFKCVSETSKVIITFSEKSARIPDALTMAEFLPVVVIVMVEECSIPIQLTNMKCVDATKDTNTWLNQLLIALKLRDP